MLLAAFAFSIYIFSKKVVEIQKPDHGTDIQQYNMGVNEAQSKNRFPCDTLSLMSYILDNYPQGSYLLNFDKTLTYNTPKAAVIYIDDSDGKYVFAVVARSRPGERLIEPKDIVGYNQRFIDSDSTKLGTALFFLTLFKCENDTFSKIWESPIPDDGGFNNISLEKWAYNSTPYVKVDFHYAGGEGHVDYNYFLINGLTQTPHLLMTYKGIDVQRTIANYNNDKYPDYYEYLYFNFANRVAVKDSVPFVWNLKDSVYMNTRNLRQTRPY